MADQNDHKEIYYGNKRGTSYFGDANGTFTALFNKDEAPTGPDGYGNMGDTLGHEKADGTVYSVTFLRSEYGSEVVKIDVIDAKDHTQDAGIGKSPVKLPDGLYAGQQFDVDKMNQFLKDNPDIAQTLEARHIDVPTVGGKLMHVHAGKLER